MALQSILFWIFAILGVAGGVGLIMNRNAVYAALSLILNFFAIAGLYLTLQAEFLAVIQVLVYAGAIMVLFLFVIMLLNVKDEEKKPFDAAKGAGFLLGAFFLLEMLLVFRHLNRTEGAHEFLSGENPFSKVETIGQLMMTDYLFPFEMISVILIASLIGAIVIAKRHNYKGE